LVSLAFLTCALGADLELLDEEVRCDPQKPPCLLRVRATGGHLQEVVARQAATAQALMVESNQIFAPQGQTVALTLAIKKEALPSGSRHEIPLEVHFKSAGKPGQSKKARLVIDLAAPSLNVFEGKPVAVRAVRPIFGIASGAATVLVRTAEGLTQCPAIQGVEFYRTVGEERYAMQPESHGIRIDQSAGCALVLAFALPPGNYTTAGGAVYLRAAGFTTDTPVSLVIRIKDYWWWPLIALIAGHLVMWAIRLWVSRLRPRHLNHSRILRMNEDLRLLELQMGSLSEEDRDRIRKFKAKLAQAGRLNDEGDAAAADALLQEAQTILDSLGVEQVRAVKREAHPPEPPPGRLGFVTRPIRRLGTLIVQWDLPVEFVAMAISILLGAQLFANADRFGTYEDYLKVFLFGFGISTTTQGFLAVLGQLKPSAKAV
jgi:hypothetical protein